MDIRDNKSLKSIGFATAIGAAATAVHAVLLPSEAKNAIKKTIFGQDHFIRNTIKCAKTTIKDTGKVFNVEYAIENAKSIYPVYEYMAKLTHKKLADTFTIATSAVLLAKVTQVAIKKNQRIKKQRTTSL